MSAGSDLGGAERRARAIAAMGLGPLWVRRTGRAVDASKREDAALRSTRIATLDWGPLREEVAGCTACGRCATRSRAVFGAGAARPEWLIVGAMPDTDEDASGEPFVARAGRLLDAMLSSVGLSREREVFVLDVLRCFAPDRLEAIAADLAACRPFLERQIALLAPRSILAMGGVAAAALLGGDPASREHRGTTRRGAIHHVSIAGRTIPVIAIHHPTDLLTSPLVKAEAWADLCLARAAHAALAGEAAG